MICNVFTEVAHTSQYRVSSYDSFYSKFNEGSWVGEGRGETVPTPIPQFQKTFQEMSQTQRRETRPLTCPDPAPTTAHVLEVGEGVDARLWWLVTVPTCQENVLFTTLSHVKGGQVRKESVFPLQFTVGDKGTFVLSK